MSWKNYVSSATISLLAAMSISCPSYAQDNTPSPDIENIATDTEEAVQEEMPLAKMPDMSTRAGIKEVLSHNEQPLVEPFARRWNLDYSGVVGFSVGNKEDSPIVMGFNQGVELVYVNKIDTDTLLEIGLMDRRLDRATLSRIDLDHNSQANWDLAKGRFYGAVLTHKDVSLTIGHEDDNRGENYSFGSISLSNNNVYYSVHATTDNDIGASASFSKDFNAISIGKKKIFDNLEAFNHVSVSHVGGAEDLAVGTYVIASKLTHYKNRNYMLEARADIQYSVLRSSFDVEADIFAGTHVGKIPLIEENFYLGMAVDEKARVKIAGRFKFK